MRSIYLTTVITLISLSLFSQITTDTIYSFDWNDKAESWGEFDRKIATYNNGLKAAEILQVQEDGIWVNYNFKAYYYDNGKLVEEFEQYWNDIKLRWDDNYRLLYSYDKYGNLTTLTHQNIFNDKYVNSMREIMTYTPDGKLIEKVIQKYEEAWSNFIKYKYFYNAKELLTEENLAYWDAGTWSNNSFVINFDYDSKNRLIEKTKTKLSENGKEKLIWEEFFYDGNGYIEEHNVYEYSKKGWESKNRALYVNNTKGNVISMLAQYWDKKDWANYSFTDYPGNFIASPIASYDENSSVVVYPDFFNNRAKVEFDNPYNELYYVRVLNQDGNIIGSATTSDNEISISLKNLRKGLYFVELQGSNSFSGKFSIK